MNPSAHSFIYIFFACLKSSSYVTLAAVNLCCPVVIARVVRLIASGGTKQYVSILFVFIANIVQIMILEHCIFVSTNIDTHIGSPSKTSESEPGFRANGW
ncbi:hypothetical protein SCHPADRAFT_64233 [Schizopora paradoxa]|uniref:Uncharacterized protein n=1 Tax=Schizopora paradoxa TaxID=27342 RepID=A0A0H2S5K9_9AGAM|nr:hypothetical protein SCHPADRAFT_64233 [Schizopora paradoxa]